MKRLIAMIILFLILVSICAFEEIFLSSFVSNFTAKAQTLSTLIEENENLESNSQIKNTFSSLKNSWHNAKTTFCFFTNYEKIKSMDESFIKLEASINNNDKNLANENVAMICNYEQFFNYMMGFNINNLF